MNSPSPVPQWFDRRLKRLHRNRAAHHIQGNDLLLRECAARITERLTEDITLSFPTALDLGCRHHFLAEALQEKTSIHTLWQSDMAETMQPDIVVDEEFIPFRAESFDLITSNLTLHWVNDLPGCLRQLHHCLKPGGLLLATMLGGHTLGELRHAITEAEIKQKDGISPRISPFTLVKDAGRLLQRSGYALPVADSEAITILYDHPFQLMRDLRAMGETNALAQRNPMPTSRTTMEAIADAYLRLYGDDEGCIPATFEVITLTGWKEN